MAPRYSDEQDADNPWDSDEEEEEGEEEEGEEEG